MIFGEIPSHIEPSILLGDLKGTKRLKEPIVHGIVYILSCITFHTIVKEGRTEYVYLNKEILDKIIGKGRGGLNRVKFIIDLLKSNEIIETKKHVQHKKSTGYKFRNKHKTDDLIKFPYGERISSIIKNFIQGDNGEYTDDFKYDFLEYQFESNTLIIDELFLEHLKSVSGDLLLKCSKKNTLRNPSILILINYLGRLLNSTELINRGEFNPKVSLSNHRFSSLLTRTPKILRNYMRINGVSITEVDIKSCQPYLLSTILFSEFTSSDAENEFNLKTVFPELFYLLNEIGFISLSNDGNHPHNLLHCYLSDEEFESVNQFRNIDFTNDFYNHIIVLASENGIVTNRDKVKNKTMSYLFGEDELNRTRNDIQMVFENHYCGLNRLIERFNYMWKNKEFSILLQRTESYIFLKRVLQEINTEYPDTPIFTIHDSVYTTEEFGEFIRNEVKYRIENITNKPVGINFSVKSSKIEDLKNKVLLETKVVSMENFKSKSKGLLTNHIELGFDFLFPNGNQELRDYIDEFYNT
jgi:hypothetical protein